ncbi:MAG TPA: molybdopterin-dependent oxidoreductase [Chloroflexota bacterium]|nr:molybdopterin-dependent oxidoreductase [Chloroflexota bacterium]
MHSIPSATGDTNRLPLLQEHGPTHLGRRVFLAAMAAGVAGLAVDIRGAPGLSLIAGAFTENGFQIYTTSGVPIISPANFRLRVEGLVRRPLTLSLAHLLAMPAVRLVRDYHCVTGWSVPGVAWTGIRLRDLLALAGPPLPAASFVLFHSADGSYTESLSLDQANLPDVLLAYKLNDQPLSHEQGYPLRLVISEMYGFKNIKWVDRITLAADLVPGYWEQRGYAIDAWLGPRSNYGKDFGPNGQR